jgi:DTW domain-containing protein YfiP
VWLQPGAVLLFPDDTGSAPPLPEVVTHLVVLDGSWSQARRAARRLPGLSALPRLSLSPRETSAPRLRRESTDEGRSTLEAIADAVSFLSGESLAAPLRALYKTFAARVLSARGQAPHDAPSTR